MKTKKIKGRNPDSRPARNPSKQATLSSSREGMSPDHVIELMRAFKRGAKFQKRSHLYPEWFDWNLQDMMTHTVQYRIKPGSDPKPKSKRAGKPLAKRKGQRK